MTRRRNLGEWGYGGQTGAFVEVIGAGGLGSGPEFAGSGGFGAGVGGCGGAQARGYYEPDEDERLRDVFARYLGVRGALWETVHDLVPVVDAKENEVDWDQRLRAFGTGFCAAALLVRAGSFLVELVDERKVVRRKLDEAEPRYGIERKSFSKIYKRLASTRWMWRCHEAARFYEIHREDLEEAMAEEPFRGLFGLLRDEEPLIAARKRDYLKRGLKYRLHNFKRRHLSGFHKVMFHLFQLSGRTIAELKTPFIKPIGAGKRVTAAVREEVSGILKAGDVIVTRQDDALSNLFLPGFWPHAAFYIGSLEEREALGVEMDAERRDRSGGEVRFLESKADGVLFRPMEETLAVDAFTVLRPRLTPAELAAVLGRAMTHEGKLYDFAFDFSEADRLACTELVYRSYHSAGVVGFDLVERTGRRCLSAEDLLDQALGSGRFEVLALFGVGEDRLWTGEEARERLKASYR